MIWDHYRFVCGFRIAQWGETPGRPIPWVESEEKEALDRLIKGEHCTVMATLTEGASAFHQAGYTHLVTVDTMEPKSIKKSKNQISGSFKMTEYWLTKLERK